MSKRTLSKKRAGRPRPPVYRGTVAMVKAEPPFVLPGQPTDGKPETWAGWINDRAKLDVAIAAAVTAIISIGEGLRAARAALPDDAQWERLFASSQKRVGKPPVPGAFRFDQSTALRYMAIAQDQWLAAADAATRGSMPTHWRTLYELSKVAPEIRQAALTAGVLTPDLSVRDAAKLVERAKAKPNLPPSEVVQATVEASQRSKPLVETDAAVATKMAKATALLLLTLREWVSRDYDVAPVVKELDAVLKLVHKRGDYKQLGAQVGAVCERQVTRRQKGRHTQEDK